MIAASRPEFVEAGATSKTAEAIYSHFHGTPAEVADDEAVCEDLAVEHAFES